jgi:melibiose permease/lactose/raffinose/galactose permease
VTAGGITVMKLSMLIFPLIAIVAGYIVYMKKFTIDEKRYAAILADLKERGDIADDQGKEKSVTIPS